MIWTSLTQSRASPPSLLCAFFAAFHVVIFHFQAMQIFIGPVWFQKLSSIGYVGVSFFFVLSSFILVYTYAGRPMILKNFWRARFARIYPAYAFSLRDRAILFLCCLDREYSIFRLGQGAFEACVRPSIESSLGLGATGSPYMECGRLEPVRRSLFLPSVSVLGAGPRSPLAAAVVAPSCRVLADVSCPFGLLCGTKPRSLVDCER